MAGVGTKREKEAARETPPGPHSRPLDDGREERERVMIYRRRIPNGAAQGERERGKTIRSLAFREARDGETLEERKGSCKMRRKRRNRGTKGATTAPLTVFEVEEKVKIGPGDVSRRCRQERGERVVG